VLVRVGGFLAGEEDYGGEVVDKGG
jgi:hypothetical protein